MDQKDIDALNALYDSVPAEFIKNNQKMIQLFEPSMREVQSLLSSPKVLEVIRHVQAIKKDLDQVKGLNEILGRDTNLISAKTSSDLKQTEESEKVAQEIIEESSEDLNPVIQMTEESVHTASELDWNKIKNLEPNEEIPEAEVQILRRDPLFSLIFKKLKGINPDKITASDIFKWLGIIHLLLGILSYICGLTDRFS